MALTKEYTVCRRGISASSSFSSTKKGLFCPQVELLKSGSSDSRNASFRVHNSEMAPICKSRIKKGKVEDEAEDGDFSDRLRKEELLDSNNCVWLSSGSATSPSSCFEGYRLSGHLDLPIDGWLISLLSSPTSESASFISTSITFFDGSRANPIEEASLVLEQRIFPDEVVLQDELKEEEVVSWLVTSIENESTEEVVPSQTRIEDSRWIPDKKSELAYFQYDSPRKVYRSLQSSSSNNSSLTDSSDGHSLFSSSSGSDSASDIVDLEEFNSDKPLFWPSDWTSEWASEAKWDFFVMSPRKDMDEVGKSPKTSPDNLRLRVFSRNIYLEKGCNRRLVFGTGSNSSAAVEMKSTSETKEFGKLRSMPSRLRKSIKSSMKVVPLYDEDNNGERIEDEVFTKKPAVKHKVLLEDLLLAEKLNVEPRIEKVLGLDEFDGHEGVDSEFNKDDFSLDGIL